jgi:hypothetical protein
MTVPRTVAWEGEAKQRPTARHSVELNVIEVSRDCSILKPSAGATWADIDSTFAELQDDQNGLDQMHWREA